VTSSKYPQPRQIVYSLESSSSYTTHGVITDSHVSESCGIGEIDGVHRLETSDPVADKICVTGPDEGLNAGLDDIR
jgi:hypothetical protein